MKQNSDRQPKVIILRGNSGSGKTTVAKLLRDASNPPAVLLSQDVFRRQIVKEKEHSGRMISQEIMLEGVKIALASSRHVIIEGIFRASKYEEFFTDVFRLNPGQCYFFYFDIPLKETLKRHQTKPNANEFGEAEMRDWWREKDFLSGITEVIIDQTKSQSEALNLILKTCEDL